MSHKWYAIQTHAGSEKSVKIAIEALVEELKLQDKIKEILVPTEDIIEVKNRKKKIVEKSLYSGYCFALMDLTIALMETIRNLPKVSGFIGDCKRPTPLSQKDIDLIVFKANTKAAPKPKIEYIKGEVIRITEGPFANFTASVNEYDIEHGILKVNVSIFGRSTPVDISYAQVEKII